jgi:DNA mismatch repair protein MutS
MAGTFSRIKNYNVSVKEVGNKVIFLRKLAAGGSNHSFGIHVAKMAGMPVRVIEKAKDILVKLEKSHSRENLSGQMKEVAQSSNMQLSFFQLDDPTLSEIKEMISSIDINAITPMEAMMKLNEIKKLTGSK